MADNRAKRYVNRLEMGEKERITAGEFVALDTLLYLRIGKVLDCLLFFCINLFIGRVPTED